MNLFIELHETRHGSDARRFGTGWENLFTEQLSFFLSDDRPAASALARLFLGANATVASISTQQWLADGTPDLRFDLADGGHFFVEHKFDSPLGDRQLERYLQNGRVALVSRCSQSVPGEVLAAANYLRPVDRPYFDWTDIYRALAELSAAPDGFGGLRNHFLGYMRELGLNPVSNPEWRALFGERTVPENQRIQRHFGRMLDPIKHVLRERGYRVSDSSHRGRVAYAQAGSAWLIMGVMADVVRADSLEANAIRALDPGYEALTVGMTFEADRGQNAWSVYHALKQGYRDGAARTWYTCRPKVQTNKRINVSLATPLGSFLSGGGMDADAMCRSALEVMDLLVATANATSENPADSSDCSAQPAVPNGPS